MRETGTVLLGSQLSEAIDNAKSDGHVEAVEAAIRAIPWHEAAVSEARKRWITATVDSKIVAEKRKRRHLLELLGMMLLVRRFGELRQWRRRK